MALMGILFLEGLFIEIYAQQPSSAALNNDNDNTTTETAIGGYSVSMLGSYGKIFKHTKRFGPTVTEPSQVYELYLGKHTNGKHIWEGLLHYPVIGLSFIHARFGNSAIFGQAFGLMPSLAFQTRRKHWSLNYRIGIGMAYLNKPYDAIQNPSNNVIGSNWNNITQLALFAEGNLHPNWRLLGMLSFTHFSNGRTQAPNLGINVPAAGLGLRYIMPQKSVVLATPKDSSTQHYSRKIHAGLKLGHGFTDGEPMGGPKYPVYVAQVYLTKRIATQWQLLAGIETNYYASIYYYNINQGNWAGQEAVRALKVAPYIGGELFMGRVSFVGTAGFYAYNPDFKRGIVPTKIGLQYYARPTYHRVGGQLYWGVYLKAHFSVADYVEVGMGYTF